jgi:hypothetical protein
MEIEASEVWIILNFSKYERSLPAQVAPPAPTCASTGVRCAVGLQALSSLAHYVPARCQPGADLKEQESIPAGTSVEWKGDNVRGPTAIASALSCHVWIDLPYGARRHKLRRQRAPSVPQPS